MSTKMKQDAVGEASASMRMTLSHSCSDIRCWVPLSDYGMQTKRSSEALLKY